jgi:RNA polymerase-interacting CarD/CdnL/TRCF family regulator
VYTMVENRIEFMDKFLKSAAKSTIDEVSLQLERNSKRREMIKIEIEMLVKQRKQLEEEITAINSSSEMLGKAINILKEIANYGKPLPTFDELTKK